MNDFPEEDVCQFQDLSAVIHCDPTNFHGQKKSDIGQATDQTTTLLFPPKILVSISFTIMRGDYNPVHRAQLKKVTSSHRDSNEV